MSNCRKGRSQCCRQPRRLRGSWRMRACATGWTRRPWRDFLEMPPTDEVLGTQTVLLSRGTPPEPEQSGRVELLFKQRPDPGKLLEAGSIDFREGDAVPQVKVGELLARRTLPIPGKVGKDVRGRVVQPPKQEPERLSPGPNVVAKEETGETAFLRHEPRLAAGHERYPSR